MRSPRLVVLISGRGSNLRAIHDAIITRRLQATIAAVVSNDSTAAGLQWARQHALTSAVVASCEYRERSAFDRILQDTIDRHRPDWVILAGFMRILGDAFVTHYNGRLLNIHPSLLPGYPGLDTHARVLAAGEHWHGASVHFVSTGLDAGPVIAQARVPVYAGDDPERLAERVLQQEHRLYPWAISLCSSGRITLAGNRVLDRGQPLDAPLRLPPENA